MSPGARYAVCERVLREGSFAGDVALAVAAGIRAVGVDQASVDDVGVDEAQRILDGEGARASSYMGLDDILQADGGTAALDEVARRLDVAAHLGAPGALVGTGPLRALPEAQANAICRDWLVRAAPLAADRALRIMLEPMHPLMRRWSFVHTLRHALTFVEDVAGAGVVVDFGHVWWEDGLDVLLADHVDDIVSVQVTNVDTAALEDIRYERAPLDIGDVPVGSLVRLLEAAGYRGWYENETLVRIPRNQRLDMLRASREWFEALDLS
ncbi:MAG: sugar phosphate isomerase/epimerase [Acidimicrobiia bacterium]